MNATWVRAYERRSSVDCDSDQAGLPTCRSTHLQQAELGSLELVDGAPSQSVKDPPSFLRIVT